MSVNSSSIWAHQIKSQIKSGHSTKSVSGKQKVKKELSNNGLKERQKNQENIPQSSLAKHSTSKQTIPQQQRTPIPPKSKSTSEVMQKLDNDFVKLLSQVQEYYTKLTKHQQIRVQKWIVKIIQKDETLRWKQNRNNYLKLLYHIVRHNETLLQPFDKIPDPDKDLPYLSEHDYCTRTKSRNDSKLSVFHPFKPQIIRINEPKGDNCSVLMSLVNTARTARDKENVIVLEDCQEKLNREILNSKILGEQIKESQIIEYSRQYSQLNSKVIHESALSIQGKNGSVNDQVKFSSSAIPSNLPSCGPSQVKQSITPFSHSNHSFLFSINQSAISNNMKGKQVSISNFSKEKIQSNNSQWKKSIKNDENGNLPNNKKKSITSQQPIPRDNSASQSPSSQLRVYNELLLTMGKILLKNESTIKVQSEYWQLLKMIYSYNQSSKNNFDTNKRNNRSKSQYYQESSQQYISSFSKDESFQQFINRLKQQVSSNIKQQSLIPNDTNSTELNKIAFNLNLSPLPCSSKNQSFVLTNKGPSHVQQHPSKQMNKNFMNCNNETDTINHITEQSLDFKVEEGVGSEDMLYYELGNRRRQSQAKEEVEGRGSQHVVGGQRMSVECPSGVVNNEQRLQSSQHMSNSLMQISDSYRQIRRLNNHTQKQPPKTYFAVNNPNSQDYHNVYDQPSEEEDEISFTDKQLIDEEEYEGESENESEEIEIECGDMEDEKDKQEGDNAVFTEDDEDQECYEEDYVLYEQQNFYDQDDEGFYHGQPSQPRQPVAS